MSKPELSAVPSFYHSYINQVQEDELDQAIAANSRELFSILEDIPDDKWSFRYAEGKWSIKEMVQHIIDAERIFSYRALRFARKDQTPLPGFDENLFAEASKADGRTKQALISELRAVRAASALMFSSFDNEQLGSSGVSNNNGISVKAIGFIVAGHAKHHLNVLQERYLR
jgi:hypothetical protein